MCNKYAVAKRGGVYNLWLFFVACTEKSPNWGIFISWLPRIMPTAIRPRSSRKSNCPVEPKSCPVFRACSGAPAMLVPEQLSPQSRLRRRILRKSRFAALSAFIGQLFQTVFRCGTQFFFDTNQLVVLCHAVRT